MNPKYKIDQLEGRRSAGDWGDNQPFSLTWAAPFTREDSVTLANLRQHMHRNTIVEFEGEGLLITAQVLHCPHIPIVAPSGERLTVQFAKLSVAADPRFAHGHSIQTPKKRGGKRTPSDPMVSDPVPVLSYYMGEPVYLIEGTDTVYYMGTEGWQQTNEGSFKRMVSIENRNRPDGNIFEVKFTVIDQQDANVRFDLFSDPTEEVELTFD